MIPKDEKSIMLQEIGKGKFSPVLLPFWVLILLSLMLNVVYALNKNFNHNFSVVNSDWWGMNGALWVISISVISGLVKLLMVIRKAKVSSESKLYFSIYSIAIFIPTASVGLIFLYIILGFVFSVIKELFIG